MPHYRQRDTTALCKQRLSDHGYRRDDLATPNAVMQISHHKSGDSGERIRRYYTRSQQGRIRGCSINRCATEYNIISSNHYNQQQQLGQFCSPYLHISCHRHITRTLQVQHIKRFTRPRPRRRYFHSAEAHSRSLIDKPKPYPRGCPLSLAASAINSRLHE